MAGEEKAGIPEAAGSVSDKGQDLSDFTEKEAPGLSFFEHLRELRGRLIKALISILPGVLVCYELSGPILNFLTRPLMNVMPQGGGLIATGLPETFLIHVKISVWAGLIATSPFWLYQLWAFVAPGLYHRERRAIARLTLATVVLLLAGAAFAYYVVLPIGFTFFLSFGGGDITILPVVHEYLSLVMTLLLSFGVAFELPLLLMFLASIGIIDSKKLSRFRPYALVIIATLAAFLTPPDVISQILMSIPMVGLYELSLFLIRQKEKALARELAEGTGDGQDDGAGEGREAPLAKATPKKLGKLERQEAKRKAAELKKEAKESKKREAELKKQEKERQKREKKEEAKKKKAS
jgi:sec-independent protein translocase protein TatC